MKKATSFRLSEPALNVLTLLARRWGISQTAVLEILIRQAQDKPQPVMPSATRTR